MQRCDAFDSFEGKLNELLVMSPSRNLYCSYLVNYGISVPSIDL